MVLCMKLHRNYRGKGNRMRLLIIVATLIIYNSVIAMEKEIPPDKTNDEQKNKHKIKGKIDRQRDKKTVHSPEHELALFIQRMKYRNQKDD